MNSTDDSLLLPQICINGEKLSNSLFYRIILGLKLFSCLLGIIGNYYLLKIEGIRWLAHPNAKIVYIVHIFWSTYVPIVFFVPLGFDFFRLFMVSHSNPCDYTIPLVVGFWIRFVGALGNITQSYTMLAFTLERSLATIFPKQYEQIKCSMLGWILGLGAVIVAFSHIIILLAFPNNHFEGRGFVTSLVTPQNSANYTYHLLIMMYLEISTATIFTVNLVANRIQKKTLKIGAIAHKYQIKETSKLITALFPCFWIHFVIFFTPTVVLGLRRKMDPPLTDIQNIEWIEYQLYSIFMPAVVLFLRQRERRKTVVNSHHGMDDHFEQLKAMFK